MNINSKRFHITEAAGLATIRDRDAPYFPHVVSASAVPSVDACARMTEAQFDAYMARLCYQPDTP